jgi:hypothetical protein
MNIGTTAILLPENLALSNLDSSPNSGGNVSTLLELIYKTLSWVRFLMLAGIYMILFFYIVIYWRFAELRMAYGKAFN